MALLAQQAPKGWRARQLLYSGQIMLKLEKSPLNPGNPQTPFGRKNPSKHGVKIA